MTRSQLIGTYLVGPEALVIRWETKLYAITNASVTRHHVMIRIYRINLERQICILLVCSFESQEWTYAIVISCSKLQEVRLIQW
jgi:hypothetical protein